MNKVKLTDDINLFAWYTTQKDAKIGNNHFDHLTGQIISDVRVGQALRIPKNVKLQLCHVGLHACLSPLDTFKYVALPRYMFRVILSKEIVLSTNKVCAREREILWGVDLNPIKKQLKEFILKKLFSLLRKKTHQPIPLDWMKAKSRRNNILIKINDPNYELIAHIMYMLGYEVNNCYAKYVEFIFVNEDFHLNDIWYQLDKNEIETELLRLIYSAPKLTNKTLEKLK